MTAQVLHGRPVAEAILHSVADRVRRLGNRPKPHLAFVMIGESGPARVYLDRLQRLGARVGIEVSQHALGTEGDLSDLERTVGALNADHSVDGVLVQMPLPDHLMAADLSSIIEPRKDVDGLTVTNAGRLYLGVPGQRPPTALAMMQMLSAAGVSPTAQHAVVIGRSNVVGHPVAELLLDRDATVTVTHRQTPNLSDLTRQADILMVGAGEPELVRGDMVKEGVVIVDAGINVSDGRVTGDVDFEECVNIASVITPVPGGVGPVTNAMLARNLIDSAEYRRG